MNTIKKGIRTEGSTSILINNSIDINIIVPLDMKTVTCRDAGFDCSAVIQGETEDEIMRKAEEHAMKEHNMKSEDITPEMRQKIKGVIHTT